MLNEQITLHTRVRVLEPCPFCESDEIVVTAIEGVAEDVLVCHCRTCERKWHEHVPELAAY
jgi:transcription elongation factor Elf1